MTTVLRKAVFSSTDNPFAADPSADPNAPIEITGELAIAVLEDLTAQIKAGTEITQEVLDTAIRDAYAATAAASKLRAGPAGRSRALVAAHFGGLG